MRLKHLFLVALFSSYAIVTSSYAQSSTAERTEVLASQSPSQAFTGIGFVAPRDGTLEVDLEAAFRAGFELFTDIPDVVLLEVAVNEEVVILSEKIFTRNWDVVTTPNQVLCGVDLLQGQTYTGSETVIIGAVSEGDEVTLRFLTPFAVYGSVIDFDLDSSFITEENEEWSIGFIGNGRAEFINFNFVCTIPQEELLVTVRYGSGVAAPSIDFLLENPVTQELEETDHLDIGHWENAYELEEDGSLTLVDGNPVVKNDDGDNFITADPDRFYVRVTDQLANIPDENGNPVQNFITVQLETLLPGPTSASEEQPQTLVLGESDVDTGVFISAPQLLVTQDVGTLPDDGFEANNNMGSFSTAYTDYALAEGLPAAGSVADNEATDPTHKATVGGRVSVQYTSDGGDVTGSASVCNPADIKNVELNIFIYDEPYIDGGFINSNQEFIGGVDGEFDWEGKDYSVPFDVAYEVYLTNPNVPSEAYIDFSTPPAERAGVIPKPGNEQRSGSSWGPVFSAAELPGMVDNMSATWAQACITASYTHNSATTIPDPTNGEDVRIDGRFDFAEDLSYLEGLWLPILGVDDVIQVFVVGDNDQGYAGVSIAQTWGDGRDGVIDVGDIAYMILSPLHEASQSQRALVLPHEVGHLITNLQTADSQNGGVPAPEFVFFPRQTIGDDNHYGKSRRISQETEAQAASSPFLNQASAFPCIVCTDN